MIRLLILIILFSLAYGWLNSNKDSEITKNIEKVNEITKKTLSNTGELINTIDKLNKIKEDINNIR